MIKLPKFTAKNLFLLLLLVCVSWVIGLFSKLTPNQTGIAKAQAQCWTTSGSAAAAGTSSGFCTSSTAAAASCGSASGGGGY